MRGNSDRFYVRESLGNDLLCIEDKVLIRQWRKVLRLGEGDTVRLFDGSGFEYWYQIVSIKDGKMGEINLKLTEKKFFKNTVNKIFLGFGVLNDRTRMEWMMEKCTELGVDGFIPLQTDNCQIFLPPRLADSSLKEGESSDEVMPKLKKQERLHKIIIEACEQSGRVRIPMIRPISRISEIEDYLKKANLDVRQLRVVVLEKTNFKSQILISKQKNKSDILLLVGPEGGWSEGEKKLFWDRGYEFRSVGSNVLRAETAAVIGVGLARNN